MWWEALESMIQELYDVETDADKADAYILELEDVNDDVGAAEEILGWETSWSKTLISSQDKPYDSPDGCLELISDILMLIRCTIGSGFDQMCWYTRGHQRHQIQQHRIIQVTQTFADWYVIRRFLATC